MAGGSCTDLVYSVLRKLREQSFKEFKEYLNDEDILSPHTAVPRAELEGKDRLDISGLLIRHYTTEHALNVTLNLLEAIKETDLTKNSDPYWEEEACVEHLAGLLSMPQEQDGKETKRQSLLLVSLARTDAETLVKDYLSQQGSPFSDNSKPPTLVIDDVPVLDKTALPTSPWKRLALSLSAFISFSGWFAAVLNWQRSLNPKSRDLLRSLEVSRNNSLAISSNLGDLLGQNNLSTPPSPTISNVFKQKVAGYVVCKNYYDWLAQTEKDLIILVAESAV